MYTVPRHNANREYFPFLHLSFFGEKSRSKKKKDLINNVKLRAGFMNSLWVRRLDGEVAFNWHTA